MVFVFEKFKIKLEESSTYNQVPGYLVHLLGIDYRKVISEGVCIPDVKF